MAITITFSNAGDFSIEDDGIPGNGTSIVRRLSDGAILAVIPHPADSLTIRATVPGVNLSVNMTDAVPGSVTFGSLTNPGECPDSIAVRRLESAGAVVLAASGSITELGSDAAPDIIAASVVLSAGTGVGTGPNALELRTSVLEAETTTGGITLANQGAVTVGGLSDEVAGLRVVTSGSISLTNTGGIILADETGFDSVSAGSAGGNVFLTALGLASDITSSVDQSAILASGGDITLNAGRDILFGTAGADFGNDVRARGHITFTAGRDVTVDGFADVFADGIGDPVQFDLRVTAGRDINVAATTGSSASLTALDGGDVFLTTGAGGTLNLAAPSTNAVFGANVIVRADRVAIASASGITAAGFVTLRTVTAGLGIDLGAVADPAFVLALSAVELDRIFTETLNIGDGDTDTMTISAALTPAATNLVLTSGGDLLANADVTVGGTLTLSAADNLLLALAAALTGTSVTLSVDASASDPGLGGTLYLNGTINGVQTASGGADDDTLNGNAQANLLLGGGGDDLLVGLAGNDTLVGGAGADTLEGGADTDTLSYVGSNARVVVRLDLGTAEFGHAAGDVISGFENLTGSDHNDSLIGEGGVNLLIGGGGDDFLGGLAGTDTLQGGLGDDRLSGGADGDVLEGGDGTDTLIYTGSAVGVKVRLGLETAEFGDAAGDVISGFENLVGSAMNDVLIGSGGANLMTGANGADFLGGLDGADDLQGEAGDDRLFGGTGDDVLNGGAGADILDGEGGVDTASYAGSNAKVTVRLYNNTASGGHAAGDTLTDFENLTGSDFNDTLIGSAVGNRLSGGQGADFLGGLDGDDILVGEAGADRLNGGTGADLFVFAGASGADEIIDFQAGVGANDVIRLDSAIFADFADVLANTNDDGLGNTIIAKGGMSILLTGVLEAQLTAGDFAFAPAGGPLEVLAPEIRVIEGPAFEPKSIETAAFPAWASAPLPAGDGGWTGPTAGSVDDGWLLCLS